MSNEFDSTNPFDGPSADAGFELPSVGDAQDLYRVEPGEYVGTWTGIELKSANPPSTNKILVFKFDVDVGRERPMDIWARYTLIPSIMVRVANTYKALGLEEGQRIHPSLINGQRCIVVVADNEYGGKVNSRVMDCKTLENGAAAVPEDDVPF